MLVEPRTLPKRRHDVGARSLRFNDITVGVPREGTSGETEAGMQGISGAPSRVRAAGLGRGGGGPIAVIIKAL